MGTLKTDRHRLAPSCTTVGHRGRAYLKFPPMKTCDKTPNQTSNTLPQRVIEALDMIGFPRLLRDGAVLLRRNHALSWLRVFRSGDALRVGHGGRQARQTEAMRSEKCVVRYGRTWDGMRVIAVCFTRTLQRCACPTNTHFLLILQEVQRIAKTRNQLIVR